MSTEGLQRLIEQLTDERDSLRSALNSSDARRLEAQKEVSRMRVAYDALAKLMGIDVSASHWFRGTEPDPDPAGFPVGTLVSASMVVNNEVLNAKDIERREVMSLAGETIWRKITDGIATGELRPDADHVIPIPQPLGVQRWWSRDEFEEYMERVRELEEWGVYPRHAHL